MRRIRIEGSDTSIRAASQMTAPMINAAGIGLNTDLRLAP